VTAGRPADWPEVWPGGGVQGVLFDDPADLPGPAGTDQGGGGS
jgi:hypothetical protein